MHPALQSWRDELPSSFVRLLAYLCAVLLLSIAAARFSESPKAIDAITPVHESKWIDIRRPFPAFALSTPEAAPSTYAIRRHADGGGRKDILELGDADDRRTAGRDRRWGSGAWTGRSQTCGSGPGEQVWPADGHFLFRFERHTASMPRVCARIRRSAPAIVWLVLPGWQRIHPAEHLGLRTRSVDPTGRRQRAKSWCSVCTRRAQPYFLRSARPDPGRYPEISFALESIGQSAKAASHRTLAGHRLRNGFCQPRSCERGG